MTTSQVTFEERKLKLMRTVQFLVYCWALRLAFVAVGSVLVSLFQFIIPSSNMGIQIQHIKIFSWSTVIKEDYRHVKFTEPVLFRGLDVISPLILKSRLLRVTPIAEMKLKVSNDDIFTHFDEQRVWSKRFVSIRPYSYISSKDMLRDSSNYRTPELLHLLASSDTGDDTQNTCLSNDKVCITAEQEDLGKRNAAEKQYIYGTHSNALPYLTALSPALAQFISLENAVPQVCFWLSSPDITATLHYDLEDNLLLQVSGTKKVIIVSPEAVDRLIPHSSWHPYWRQASGRQPMRTATQIIKHLASKEEIAEVCTNKPCPSTSVIFQYANSSSKGNSLNKIRKMDIDRTAKVSASSKKANNSTMKTSNSTNKNNNHNSVVEANRGAYGEYRVWEVELTPGCMVSIPAGYFHTVTAGADSVSINAWFRSALSDAHALFVNVPLPFSAKDSSPQTKLTRLAVAVRQLLTKLEMSPDLFARTMGARYAVLLIQNVTTVGGWDQDAGNSGNALCIQSEVHAAVGKELVEGTAVATSVHHLYDILHSRPSLSPALITLSLLDYVEEILALVWGDSHLNPADAYKYATQCFATHDETPL